MGGDCAGATYLVENDLGRRAKVGAQETALVHQVLGVGERAGLHRRGPEGLRHRCAALCMAQADGRAWGERGGVVDVTESPGWGR